MATTKMTREQMIEKLDSLKAGTKIRKDGKVYTVFGIGTLGGKLHRRDMNLLEEGKPATYEHTIDMKYRNGGKVIACSNLEHRSWYATKMYMDFEIIG